MMNKKKFMTDLKVKSRPFEINELEIPDNLKILILAPHPDDFDAVGVTLGIFHKNGNKIHLVVATGGASGVEDSFCPLPSVEKKTLVREKEQLESCKFFGIEEGEIEFLRMEEDLSGQPVNNEKNYNLVKTAISRFCPDLVFLPHGNDTNICHQMINKMLEKYCKSTFGELLAFLNRDPKTIKMRADCYTVFDEKTALWKAKLLRCHKSQHQRNLNTRNHGFDDRILSVNAEIARELGQGKYAEMFEIKLFSH